MSDQAKTCECGQPATAMCHGLMEGEGGVWRSCQKPLCDAHIAGTQTIHLNYAKGKGVSGWYAQPLCGPCHERRQARIAEVQRRKAEKEALASPSPPPAAHAATDDDPGLADGVLDRVVFPAAEGGGAC